jgi:hypothetical protein
MARRRGSESVGHTGCILSAARQVWGLLHAAGARGVGTGEGVWVCRWPTAAPAEAERCGPQRANDSACRSTSLPHARQRSAAANQTKRWERPISARATSRSTCTFPSALVIPVRVTANRITLGQRVLLLTKPHARHARRSGSPGTGIADCTEGSHASAQRLGPGPAITWRPGSLLSGPAPRAAPSPSPSSSRARSR